MLLALSFLAAFASAPPQPALAPPPDADAIVVTARPGRPKLGPDAAEYWRRFCLDPTRLAGRPAAPPGDDPDWALAPEATRRQLALSGEDAAFDHYDAARGQGLILTHQSFDLANGLHETRCTLIVLGGTDQAALSGRVSSLMGGPGTQRHVGEPDGVPLSRLWRQWAWTAMPSRRSKAWRAVTPSGAARGAGTWLVVIDPARFYAEYDYVLADLKTKTGPKGAVSVLTLAWTRQAVKERRRR
jgi:hypothetical protein